MNTTCAACGKQLDFDAPRCVRCKSKYCECMALKLKKALEAEGRRQNIEMLKQAVIKVKVARELHARKAKVPRQDAPPPRTFARGWLDGPDSDDRWSSFQ